MTFNLNNATKDQLARFEHDLAKAAEEKISLICHDDGAFTVLTSELGCFKIAYKRQQSNDGYEPVILRGRVTYSTRLKSFCYCEG